MLRARLNLRVPRITGKILAFERRNVSYLMFWWRYQKNSTLLQYEIVWNVSRCQSSDEACYIWRPWDRASLMYSFKYNQQAAKLYNILYYCQCSTCFRRILRPSPGAQKLYTQHRVYVKLACFYR
jgi:hypothetical protein